MPIPDGAALLAGLAAFGIAYLLMPSVVRLVRRHDLVDQPAGRRIHAKATPRSGGLAIWFGVLGGILVSLFITAGLPNGMESFLGPLSISSALAILGGASVAALAGFLDDMRPLGSPIKLAAQVVAALPLLISPEIVGTVQQLLGTGMIAEYAAYPVIVFWVVFLMNAVNLVDGLDGLAGGLVVIAATFIVILGGLQGASLLLALALVGALLGFLRHNLPPARVFMGDTGSLMIGYVLAVLAVFAVEPEPTGRRAMAVLIVVGLPGLDTLMTVVRRLALRRNPMQPDADHLHHRMLNRAAGVHARAISTLFLLAMSLGVFGLVVAHSAPVYTGWIFSIVVALAMILLWDLGYFDITSYSEIGKPPIQKREVTRRLAGPTDAPPSRAKRTAQRRETHRTS